MVYQQPDRQRRRHRSRVQAEELAVAYEVSGLSQADFCTQNEVGVKSLARYLARYRKQKASSKETQRFLAVEVNGDGSGGGGGGGELTVCLSGGRRIEVKRGFDAGTLRQLVTVLEQR